MIKRIRQDLELDAEHGIDADVFSGDSEEADFFTAEYPQLLRRLAQM